MTFKGSFKKNVLDFFKALFTGRTSRSEFWWFVLIVVITGAIGAALFWTVLPAIIIEAYAGLLSVPLLGLIVRRCHDVGKSGWWALIPVYDIVLFCMPSQPDNVYGAAPVE